MNEEQGEELESEDEKNGIFKVELNIKITRADMLKELVKEVEGQTIKADKLKDHERN